ncbi:hypothetical protein ACNKHM_03820 [Shigella sonnei]
MACMRLAFRNSWNKWEPIAVYGWERSWPPLADEILIQASAPHRWRTRAIPGIILPSRFDRHWPGWHGPATFQMTYIPGTYNNGNVYFAWMRFQF